MSVLEKAHNLYDTLGEPGGIGDGLLAVIGVAAPPTVELLDAKPVLKILAAAVTVASAGIIVKHQLRLERNIKG